jgi:hypothetical protein
MVSQHLLDRGSHQRAVLPDQLPLHWVVREADKRVAHQTGGRVVAGDHELSDGCDQRLLVESNR